MYKVAHCCRYLLLVAASLLAGYVSLEAAAVGAEPGDGSAIELRVLTYNIHHGEGVDGRVDLERIAGVIRSVEPDIVALQEVDKNVPRSGRVDQPAELARLTGLQAVFAPSIPLDGGEYGNAVLSRLPVHGFKRHLLPRLDNGEQRSVLEVELTLPEGGPRLLLLATHLDHRPEDEERIVSARMINRIVSSRSGQPAILAGDLNAVPQSAVLSELRSEWTSGDAKPLPTIPVDKPQRQIDYILFRPEQAWHMREWRVLDEPIASDHRPLFLRIEYRSP